MGVVLVLVSVVVGCLVVVNECNAVPVHNVLDASVHVNSVAVDAMPVNAMSVRNVKGAGSINLHNVNEATVEDVDEAAAMSMDDVNRATAMGLRNMEAEMFLMEDETIWRRNDETWREEEKRKSQTRKDKKKEINKERRRMEMLRHDQQTYRHAPVTHTKGMIDHTRKAVPKLYTRGATDAVAKVHARYASDDVAKLYTKYSSDAVAKLYTRGASDDVPKLYTSYASDSLPMMVHVRKSAVAVPKLSHYGDGDDGNGDGVEVNDAGGDFSLPRNNIDGVLSTDKESQRGVRSGTHDRLWARRMSTGMKRSLKPKRIMNAPPSENRIRFKGIRYGKRNVLLPYGKWSDARSPYGKRSPLSPLLMGKILPNSMRYGRSVVPMMIQGREDVLPMRYGR